jgi:hypothetical protein
MNSGISAGESGLPWASSRMADFELLIDSRSCYLGWAAPAE